jgi:multiple sugar transport system permease protein
MSSSNPSSNTGRSVEKYETTTPNLLQRLWQDEQTTIQGYLFLIPFLVVYFIFLIFPVFRGIYISLHRWDLLSGKRGFVGISNYQRMFTNDSLFWTSTWNTVLFVLWSTPLLILISLVLAVALNRRKPGMTLFRTIFFAPYVLSISVITLIWFMIFNPNRGILASFLEIFGVEPLAWLTTPGLAMPAIIITTIWWTLGFNIILFLAGLQDIPASVYEAARLDGAGNWTMFWRITAPLLRRTIFLVAILQIIASFQIFGQVYLMTGGGPANSTRVLVQHIYEQGFQSFRLGYSSSMSMFLFAIMLVISLIQLYVAAQGDELDAGSK